MRVCRFSLHQSVVGPRYRECTGQYPLGSDGPVDVSKHWSLPPVRRFNHVDGVAPYNGTVAVTQNSEVMQADDIADDAVRLVLEQCAEAAMAVGAIAPIRIDCRRAEPGGGSCVCSSCRFFPS